MEIKASDIAKLREKTGLGIMECKSALIEAGGDEAKAIEILRKRGAAKAVKKSARTTSTGMIEAYTHDGRIGVLVEVLCETDFVVRNQEFKQLAHEIAIQIAAMNPKFVSPESVPAEEIEKEKAVYAEEAKSQGKSEEIANKIAEGKLAKYYSEVCLLNQPFVKDQDKTIGDLVTEKIAKIGEKITVSRFVRYELGESQ